MIGAVATWKFPPAHMAYLPAGAVWMSSEPKETTKKHEVLNTLEKSDGSIISRELASTQKKMSGLLGRQLSE